MQFYQEIKNLLQNSVHYYLISIGLDGTYSYVSPNYDQNFAHHYDTLLGRPFQVTLHSDDVKICEEVGALCFEHPGELFPATLRKHDGNGGYVFTQWELKAMINPDGSPEGIFCVGHNITEHIATQRALSYANERMNKQTEQLSEIAEINSHNVRRPLANVLGLAAIMARMELNEELRHIVEMMAQSAAELDTEIRTINSKTR